MLFSEHNYLLSLAQQLKCSVLSYLPLFIPLSSVVVQVWLPDQAQGKSTKSLFAYFGVGRVQVSVTVMLLQ